MTRLRRTASSATSRDFAAVRYEYASPSGFAAGINYNRASDDRYFVDFGTTIVDTSQKVLPQDGYLAYNQAYWNTAVRVTKNQVLQDPDLSQPVAKPYERVPQATVNGYIADWRGFEAARALDGNALRTPDAGKGQSLHRRCANRVPDSGARLVRRAASARVVDCL